MLERRDLSGRGEASHRDAGERPPLGEMLERSPPLREMLKRPCREIWAMDPWLLDERLEVGQGDGGLDPPGGRGPGRHRGTRLLLERLVG